MIITIKNQNINKDIYTKPYSKRMIPSPQIILTQNPREDRHYYLKNPIIIQISTPNPRFL